MSTLLSSLRILAATMLVCVIGYTAVVLGVAQALVPASANGQLLTAAGGRVVGSGRIAQGFTSPRYFWPRPSAVDYDAAAAGGSNKSPTSPDLTKRAAETVARYGASAALPLPADLAAASGAGLDPDISLPGALYQVDRIAAARGKPPATIRALVDAHARHPGGPFTAARIVNVLELNLALDRLR